ncbi:hypothetical protein ACWEP4_37255 [Streptomyces sp. NPDC004227]
MDSHSAFENATFATRCNAANIHIMPPGCVFPAKNPGWVIDPVRTRPRPCTPSVFFSNTKTRRAKLGPDKLAALGLAWAAA